MNSVRFLGFISVCLLGFCISCASEENGEPNTGFTLYDSPAGAQSGQPRLFTDDEDRLWMSWVEPNENDGHSLLYSFLDDSGWSEVREAASGESWFVNWADLPGVMPLPGGELIAWYLVRNSGNTYGYDIHMRSSSDGINWSETFSSHHDGTPTQHGFVSARPAANGILAAWLDGRETGTAGHLHGEEEGAMTLRAALLGTDGQIMQESLVDGYVCSCCPTDMVATSRGLLLAYRDRTRDEVRDISIALYSDGEWEQPYVLHQDGWKIRACPVNGPSLDAANNVVVAAWYTGANEQHTVKAAFSDDGGRSFDSPVILDDDSPIGRAGAVMISEDSALITWQGRDENGPAIRYALVSAQGENYRTATAISLGPGTPPMTPQLVQNSNRVWLAWTGIHPEDGSRIVQLAYIEV